MTPDIPIVIGVDPGFANCGVAVLRGAPAQRLQPVEFRTIKTPSSWDMERRQEWLCGELSRTIPTPSTVVIGCEEQARAYAGARERKETDDNALYVREVVGAVRMLACVHGYAFVSVSPAEMRKVLGLPAGATKEQLRKLVALYLSCPAPSSLHCSDAGAVAIAAARMARIWRLSSWVRAGE
jgi:Holliday junction resolvasome RuvABC endonuclease subunit